MRISGDSKKYMPVDDSQRSLTYLMFHFSSLHPTTIAAIKREVGFCRIEGEETLALWGSIKSRFALIVSQAW